jgi:hypothetical protein
MKRNTLNGFLNLNITNKYIYIYKYIYKIYFVVFNIKCIKNNSIMIVDSQLT